MNGRATAEHAGFLHATNVFGSDEEFVAVVAPFLRAGRDAAEPTLVGVTPQREALVRDALGDTTGVTFLDGSPYEQPPMAALRQNHELFSDLVTAGADRIRIVGEIPLPGTEVPWDGWARYEAAINHLYAALPVWAVCPYDRRTTPPEVLADVERTHVYHAGPDGGLAPNPQFVPPAEFLTALGRAEVDPLERTTPHLVLTDPSPARARHAVAGLAAATALDRDTVDDLVFAVSEVVDNALVHGRPPVTVRAWAAMERIVVAVQDRGDGPADPWVGFLPGRPHGQHAGLGLWISNQVCARMTTSRSADGFTVRLVGGTPLAAGPH